MSNPKRCHHSQLTSGCRSCEKIKNKWYQKLKKSGFHDIERGLSHPRFTGHIPDPTTPRAQGLSDFYTHVWLVYHEWMKEKRSRRDCLVAELYAKQESATGTVRGIMGVLKLKGLKPRCSQSVQVTIQEIKEAISEIIRNVNRYTDA